MEPYPVACSTHRLQHISDDPCGPDGKYWEAAEPRGFSMTPTDRRRLAAILGMLGSEFDGERAAAGLQAEAFRKKHGLTWEQMLSLPAVRKNRSSIRRGPPTWPRNRRNGRRRTRRARRRGERLTRPPNQSRPVRRANNLIPGPRRADGAARIIPDAPFPAGDTVRHACFAPVFLQLVRVLVEERIWPGRILCRVGPQQLIVFGRGSIHRSFFEHVGHRVLGEHTRRHSRFGAEVCAQPRTPRRRPPRFPRRAAPLASPYRTASAWCRSRCPRKLLGARRPLQIVMQRLEPIHLLFGQGLVWVERRIRDRAPRQCRPSSDERRGYRMLPSRSYSFGSYACSASLASIACRALA